MSTVTVIYHMIIFVIRQQSRCSHRDNPYFWSSAIIGLLFIQPGILWPTFWNQHHLLPCSLEPAMNMNGDYCTLYHRGRKFNFKHIWKIQLKLAFLQTIFANIVYKSIFLKNKLSSVSKQLLVPISIFHEKI